MEAGQPVFFQSPLRVLLIVVAIFLVAVKPLKPAEARPVGQTAAGVERFIGQVVRLFPTDSNPAGFTLQGRNRTIDFTIGPNCKFRARSAEADVEGFQAGDYALVQAHHVNRTWVTSSVDYDVEPISMVRTETDSGTVLRVSPNAKRFLMILDTGISRWVTITKKTRFRLDGQVLDPAPPLTKGSAVQVVMEHSGRLWIALDVNIRTAGSSFFR